MKNLETRADITSRRRTAQKLITRVMRMYCVGVYVTEQEMLADVEEILQKVADNAYADGVYDGRNTECERAKNLTS